jgi:hypothetical protein
MVNKIKPSVFALFFVLVLMAAISFAAVNAQSTATVTVIDQTGGTTDITGTTTYPDGTSVTITATADSAYVFSDWVISPSDQSGDSIISDNPMTFTVAGGITYTIIPVFAQPQALPGRPLPTDLTQSAIIIIYPSAGGTTNPLPGTYAMADATSFNLQATAQSGWQFSHWTICGTNTSHGSAPVNWTPTDNPYNVNHGYGDTYRYQAVFTPIGSTEPTPAPTATPVSGGTIGGMSTETLIIIGLVVVIVVILIAFGVFASRRRK